MVKQYREQFVQGIEAAKLLNISDRTLRRWYEASPNAIARHSDGRYGLISLLQFAVARRKEEAERNSPQINLLLAQARKCRIEAQIKEMERAKKADSLLDAEEVRQYWEAHWQSIERERDRLPEILPDDLFALMPDEIKGSLSQSQRDELVAAWREKFEKEAAAATDC